MRLIDADAYIDEINKRIKEAYIWYDEAQTDEVKVRAEQAIATFCEASLTAKKMPSAEPERKIGKWIEGKYRMTCNQCRYTYPNKLMNEMGIKNYCPHCGAKMEEEK